MKTVLIDDEAHILQALRSKLAFIDPSISILAAFQDPQQALKELKTLNPDVVFLDIEMPTMNGFQLLEALRPYNFEVVFVTAYNQYAIRALRMSAIDYLLKPIDIDDLKNTLSRLAEKIKQPPPQYDDRFSHFLQTLHNISHNNLNEKIALSTQEGVIFLMIKDIMRVEAMSNYSCFYTLQKQKVVVSKTLKEFEESLLAYNFLRVNRSHLVNLNHILRYNKGEGGVLTLVDNYEVEVSPQRKEELIKKLNLSNLK
jgi:two-component system, LytTR family, response regulator